MSSYLTSGIIILDYTKSNNILADSLTKDLASEKSRSTSREWD
jgi:hypothetical protein